MKRRLDFYTTEADEWNGPAENFLRIHYGGEQGWAMEGRYRALLGLIARADDCRLDLCRPIVRGDVKKKLELDDAGLDAFIRVLAEECELVLVVGGVVSRPEIDDDLERMDKKAARGRAAAAAKWKERKKGTPPPAPASGDTAAPVPEAARTKEPEPTPSRAAGCTSNASAMHKQCMSNAHAEPDTSDTSEKYSFTTNTSHESVRGREIPRAKSHASPAGCGPAGAHGRKGGGEEGREGRRFWCSTALPEPLTQEERRELDGKFAAFWGPDSLFGAILRGQPTAPILQRGMLAGVG
jgi:hypothetical protein